MHQRVGHGGKEFSCYKFRTMVPDAYAKLQQYLANHLECLQAWDKNYKLKEELRITRRGRFLRKTSLDKLLQYLNMLKGEMNLVEPRPIVQADVVK